MPPHDRLCWRFRPLIQSQAVHITKHNEPLLFLYPRWYTTTVSEPQDSADVSNDSPRGERRKKLVDPRDRHVRQARIVPSETVQTQQAPAQPQLLPENPLDTRPTSGLVRKLIVKREHEEMKLERRWQMRETYRDSRDWQSSLEALQRSTPNKASNHVKLLELLKMPDGMFGWYHGDLNVLFLEIYMFTECHVQISTGINKGGRDGSKFYSLVLAGTPATIRMAKAGLNREIRVRSDERSELGGSMDAFLTTSTVIKRDKATARAVWSEHHALPWAVAKPSDLKLPRKWSIVRFADRVANLVRRPMPRGLQHKVYGSKAGRNQDSHIDAVSEALQDLFLPESNLRFISPYSLAIAVPFLMKHRKLPAMRRIIGHLDNHKFAFTTSTFNACLQSARDAGDLHNFYFILRLMLDRGVTPDWQSWSALLHLVHQISRSDARVVLKSMRKKGMLASAPAKMDVAAVMVTADFTDWVERGGSTTAFFETYDKYFDGPEWLSESVANRMIGVRTQRGQFGDAFSILDTLIARGKRPNVVSLNTLLSSATSQRNHLAALEAVEKLVGDEASTKVRPDKITFNQLFMLAWRRCEYNMLRVVWHYACMYGEVGFALQNAFEGTIALYSPSSNSHEDNSVGIGSSTLPNISRLKLFRSLAAKAAVGISLQRSDDELDHMIALLGTQTPPDIVGDETDNTPTAERPEGQSASSPQQSINDLNRTEHEERKRRLLGLVKSDMQQVQRLRPMVNLAEMLRIAREKDSVWTGLGIRKTPNLEWILENAVQVPVEDGPVYDERGHLKVGEVAEPHVEVGVEQTRERDVEHAIRQNVEQGFEQHVEQDFEQHVKQDFELKVERDHEQDSDIEGLEALERDEW